MNRDEPVFPEVKSGLTKGELELIIYRAAALAFMMGVDTAWDYMNGQCNAALAERTMVLGQNMLNAAIESEKNLDRIEGEANP